MSKFVLAATLFLMLVLTGSRSLYGTALNQLRFRAEAAIDNRDFKLAAALYDEGRRRASTRRDSVSERQFSRDLAITHLRKQAFTAFQSGSYSLASELYGRLYRLFESAGDTLQAVRMLENQAGIQLAQFEFPQALAGYLEAKRVAESHQLETAMRVSIYSNLTILFIQLGDLESADQAAREGLKLAAGSNLFDGRAALFETLGWLRVKQNRLTEATQYFQDAIEAAGSASQFDAITVNYLSSAWAFLGEQQLLLGKYREAEQALTAAFRLRVLFKDRRILRDSLVDLAWLRVEQGDFRSASSLLTSAEALPANTATTPPWLVAWLQGRIAEQQGQDAAALSLYRRAFEQALQWQSEVPPADALRVASASEFLLRRVYHSFVHADLEADPSLALEAFTATERYRAAALEETLSTSQAWRVKLPPAYWETVTKLRVAEAEQVVHPDRNLNTTVQTYRQGLQEYETQAQAQSAISSTESSRSLEKDTPQPTLRSIQSEIRPGEALLSLYLNGPDAVLWAVTSKSFEMHRLGQADSLLELSDRFREAVERKQPDRDELGARLYNDLFGQTGPLVREQVHWIFAASDEIYRIPLAALVIEKRGNRPVYLVERHSTESAVSALMLRSRLKPLPTGPFVGVGDGIYNSADSRWVSEFHPKTAFGIPVKRAEAEPRLQLARLAGSGTEIQTCARIWGGKRSPELLTGASADRVALEDSLKKQPAVVHLATHVLYPGEQRERAFIDLGLKPDGEPDLLTSEDIGGLSVPDSLIVMSGCSSGSAGAAAGAGILGLSRAWLIAGARAVVASRWPTPDDTGEIFRSFYTYLRQNQAEATRQRVIAAALQAAQIQMLQSDTWRADSQYWAAYYVLGKE